MLKYRAIPLREKSSRLNTPR